MINIQFKWVLKWCMQTLRRSFGKINVLIEACKQYAHLLHGISDVKYTGPVQRIWTIMIYFYMKTYNWHSWHHRKTPVHWQPFTWCHYVLYFLSYQLSDGLVCQSIHLLAKQSYILKMAIPCVCKRWHQHISISSECMLMLALSSNQHCAAQSSVNTIWLRLPFAL